MRNQEQFNQSIREGNHIDAVKILDENGLISLRKSRTRQNFTDDVLLSARVTHLGDNLYGVGVCYNSYYYMINQSLWEQHPDNGVHDRFDGEVMLVDLEKGVLKSQKIDSSDKQIDWDSSLNWRLEKMGYKHFLTSYQTAVAQEKRNEEQIKKDLLVKFGEEDIFGFDPKINGIQFVPLTEDDKYACFGAYMTIPFKDTNVPEVEYVNRHLIAVVGLCEGNKIVKMKQWDKDAYRFFITERNGVQSTFEREFIGEPKVEVSGGICRMTPRILEKPTFFADSVDKMEGKKELSEQIGFAVPETIRKPRTAEKDSKTDSKEETTKANTSERVREYLKKQLNATEVSDVIGVKLENGYTAFGTYAKQNGKVSCMTV